MMTATAHCQRCDWTTTGTPTDTDKAADKHTRATGHPTTTITTPPAGKALNPHPGTAT